MKHPVLPTGDVRSKDSFEDTVDGPTSVTFLTKPPLSIWWGGTEPTEEGVPDTEKGTSCLGRTTVESAQLRTRSHGHSTRGGEEGDKNTEGRQRLETQRFTGQTEESLRKWTYWSRDVISRDPICEFSQDKWPIWDIVRPRTVLCLPRELSHWFRSTCFSDKCSYT